MENPRPTVHLTDDESRMLTNALADVIALRFPRLWISMSSVQLTEEERRVCIKIVQEWIYDTRRTTNLYNLCEQFVQEAIVLEYPECTCKFDPTGELFNCTELYRLRDNIVSAISSALRFEATNLYTKHVIAAVRRLTHA